MILATGNPAHGGSVVARQEDGRVVLVHHALPGERVEVEPRGKRGGTLFGFATRVLDPSPDRVPAPCPLFGACGGCHWQEARYPAQLAIKLRVVEDAWARAGLRLPPDTPVLGMDDPWRYRIRGEFVAIPAGASFEFGFHRLRSHAVLPVRSCPIHVEPIERAVGGFREAAAGLRVRGLRQLLLTAEPGGRGMLWDARFDGRSGAAGAAGAELGARAAELLPDLVLLEESIGVDILDLHFRVRSDSFVQANHRHTPVLYRAALEMLQASAGDRVLDLYAGIGTLSLAAARAAAAVTAVEENPSAVSLGRLAARINGTGNVEFLAGRVERVLERFRIGDHDAVLADPPRAGLDEAAVAELLRLGAGRIVYVSCEPSTHARDLARLVAGGYRLRRAAIVDMFPQTYHVESVALLERGASGG